MQLVRVAPTAALFLLLAGAFGATAASAATLSVTVQLSDGTPLSGVVVTVKSVSRNVPAEPLAHAIMDQVNEAFSPEILVVPVGTIVSFPNSDSVSHQVYSFSPAKRFQLPLYRGRPYPPEHFDTPGIVTVGCNIHDSMVGYIYVTDAGYYGQITTASGWSRELPAGNYEVSIWHPRLRDPVSAMTRQVRFMNDDVHVAFKLANGPRPAPLQGKAKKWDY